VDSLGDQGVGPQDRTATLVPRSGAPLVTMTSCVINRAEPVRAPADAWPQGYPRTKDEYSLDDRPSHGLLRGGDVLVAALVPEGLVRGLRRIKSARTLAG
jgi:hypothetical protein